MIKIGDLTLDFSNPLVIMGAIGVFLFMMLLLMGFMALRASGRSVRAIEPLAMQMGMMGENVKTLNASQHSLADG